MVNLATALSEHGNECILVTSIKEPWEYKYGNRVDRVSLFPNQMPQQFLKRNIFTTIRLRKLIKEKKPDVVVSFMAEPNFRAIIATIGLRTKCLVSVRNDPEKEYPNTLFKLAARTLYRLADGIVFQTSEAKAWFSQSIQKKSRIIFNQVDTVFFDTKLKMNREAIVTTGRLVPQKNHELLIRAFALVADRIRDNLIIYGDGELENYLKGLVNELGINNRVFFPGATQNIPEALSSAKMFVLSSDFEGMPNSLLEAMAIGLPCISTDCPCGGPRNIVEHEKSGILVPVGDVVAMSTAIENVVTNDGKLCNLGENAKIRARLFRPDVILQEWKEYIDTIVK